MTNHEAALERGVPVWDFVLANKPVRSKLKIEADPMRQTMLLTGLRCLPEQENLFDTDGEEP